MQRFRSGRFYRNRGNPSFHSDGRRSLSFLNEIMANKVREFSNGQAHNYTKQLENKYLTITVTPSGEYEDIFYAGIHHTRLPSVSRNNFVKVFSNNLEIARNFFFQPKIVETYFNQNPLGDSQFTGGLPVILLGETGTFYDSVVSYLYERNKDFHTSLTVVDLKDCKSANLNWLMDNANSPLFNTRSSLYFKISLL